jgi:hypothetical protein
MIFHEKIDHEISKPLDLVIPKQSTSANDSTRTFPISKLEDIGYKSVHYTFS